MVNQENTDWSFVASFTGERIQSEKIRLTFLSHSPTDGLFSPVGGVEVGLLAHILSTHKIILSQNFYAILVPHEIVINISSGPIKLGWKVTKPAREGTRLYFIEIKINTHP